LIGDASRKISWNAPPENTAVDESEVGSTGWAGRLIVRRELQVSRKAAPKGHNIRGVEGWIRRQGWKVDRRRKPKVSRKAAEGIQRTMRVGCCVRRQGRKVDKRRRSHINQRAAPGEHSSRRESEVRFEGRAGRWQKAQAGRERES